MYLVAIHVPIYVDGPRRLVWTDWHRSLVLLRDSLPRVFGGLQVLAPSVPPEAASTGQTLVELHPDRDGVVLTPSFDFRVSAREFWLTDRKRWKADLEALVPRATMVHAGLDDLYRPISYGGLRAAWRHGIASVVVQDMDVPLQMRQLARTRGPSSRLRARVYGALYDRVCLDATRRADLSLLKGGDLIRRYGQNARNAKEFHDTSFSKAEIVPKDVLERRIASLGNDRPLRFVYCGRMDPRKGVALSIRMIQRARELGARAAFDVIGDGPERPLLEALAAEPASAGAVRLLGSRPYGPDLLRDLATYDALLFTPTAEDTPRMIFDGYAAALPLVATEIDYVKERSRAEHATLAIPLDDVEAGARAILSLDRERKRLVELARAAHAAASYHTAEMWYERRAQWTLEAYETHNRAKTLP